MRAADLGSRRVAVWGLGREGRAAIGFLRKFHPDIPLAVLNDTADARMPAELGDGIGWACGAAAIAKALAETDVIVKSPGVSLYRPEIQHARERGVEITSLLNLWFAEQPKVTTVCVTGTKGKSTTAALISHMLASIGRRVALAGNIGVPVTEIDPQNADYAVIEMSSYQSADFDGMCDAAVLTSLYPEHIDWHGTVENYFRDKINLIGHSRCRIIDRRTSEIVQRQLGSSPSRTYLFNDETGIHSRCAEIFDANEPLGRVPTPYLARPHNVSNLCAALAAGKSLDLDPAAMLAGVCGFRGLPHRQQELGEVENVLFVDDSISTIPESTLAALAVYAGREVTVIVGGYDRGIKYGGLVDTVLRGAAKAMICLGDSGRRIYALARAGSSRLGDPTCAIFRAEGMGDAVSLAQRVTPPGGVVLLSPAAPSYGAYRDYIERGQDFAEHAGLSSGRSRASSHLPPE
jgi:UDP-N-acetylmuramoyl-L-alanine---L-glutamate ligase